MAFTVCLCVVFFESLRRSRSSSQPVGALMGLTVNRCGDGQHSDYLSYCLMHSVCLSNRSPPCFPLDAIKLHQAVMGSALSVSTDLVTQHVSYLIYS